MVTTKKKAKAAPKPKARKSRQIPLVLDAKAQDQLDKVHSITGEKTATKAIIGAMYMADHYMKEFKKEKDRADLLEYELSENKEAISGYLLSLKALDEVVKAKPGSKRPVLVQCDDCNKKVPEKELDVYGFCKDCSME